MAAFLVLGGVFLATAAAVAATLRWAVGTGMAEYHASLAVVLVAGALAWPVLRRRRVASLGLAVFGLAAILTGFWLLYWKDDLKASGLKDFAKFWHSVASFALLPLFAAHWSRNDGRLLQLAAAVRRWRLGTWSYAGSWAGVLAVGAFSWAPSWRTAFTEENYLPVVAWTWVAVVGAVYFAWLLPKVLLARSEAWRRTVSRNTRRGLVDVSLLASFVLATLTGFALLWFKDALHGNGLKYVSKYWHSATSIAFTVFVAVHVATNVAALRAHARRAREDMG